MSLQRLANNISVLLPDAYYKNGRWYNIESGAFDLEFDSVEGVFDYYGSHRFNGGSFEKNYAFLDSVLAVEVMGTGKVPTDCPSAHYLKKWLCNSEESAMTDHRFTMVLNVTDTPAVAIFYAEHDSITQCSLDASKFIDAESGKVMYKATYNVAGAYTIDWWSPRTDEVLVPKNLLNCKTGVIKMIW